MVAAGWSGRIDLANRGRTSWNDLNYLVAFVQAITFSVRANIKVENKKTT